MLPGESKYGDSTNFKEGKGDIKKKKGRRRNNDLRPW